MTDARAYRRVAIQVGDMLKYDTAIREINRAGNSVFSFERENFPNEEITSSRAQLVHDWILTLAKQKMNPDERQALLFKFINIITPDTYKDRVRQELAEAGFAKADSEALRRFTERGLHSQIVEHCRDLFADSYYFHAVFEAAKIYNRKVQEKSGSDKDGQSLMLQEWKVERGSLKVTKCETETDRNVQDGIAFLSAGLMQAVRNPTAHEPAHEWPIGEKDCLDLLSFISFLFRKLDQAVVFGGRNINA